MNIVKGMCCWGTDYCKCEFLKLARNQNIKLGYILFVVVTISIITLVSIFVEPSQSLIETFNCNTNSTELEKYICLDLGSISALRNSCSLGGC